MSRKLCLVTGASAGIGAATARVFAAQGYDLALTARRADRLTELAEELRLRFGVEAFTLPMDLTAPETPERLVAAIEGEGRSIDALVNNAGFSTAQGFAPTPWRDWSAFLQIMLTAPTQLSHLVLPGMIDRGFGRILNVASLAGFLSGSPGDTLYSPVKSYLIRFSQALHLEVRDKGVHVTALCPGYTYSEFHDVNGTREATQAAFPNWMWMGADEVARAGFEAVEACRPVIVPGAPNKVIAGLLKTLPDDWVLEISGSRAKALGRL